MANLGKYTSPMDGIGKGPVSILTLLNEVL